MKTGEGDVRRQCDGRQRLDVQATRTEIAVIGGGKAANSALRCGVSIPPARSINPPVRPAMYRLAWFSLALIGTLLRSPGAKAADAADLTVLLPSSYSATSRTALSNSPTSGVIPSSLLPCENRLEKHDDAWQFTYQGTSPRHLCRRRGKPPAVEGPGSGPCGNYSARLATMTVSVC